jgi:hypothetical protein
MQYSGAGRLFFREVGDRMRRAMAAWFTRWLPEAFGGRRG